MYNTYLLQYLSSHAALAVFLLYFGAIAINLVLVNVAAKAARRKNRSYRSFWWLGLTLTPLVTFAIVALLPFNPNDPRAPYSRNNDVDEPQLSWVNNHVKEATFSKADKGWLITGSIAFVLGIFISIAAVAEAFSNNY